MGIEFEYTAPSTHKQNGHDEWKISTLSKWVHVIFNGRDFCYFLSNGLWTEATNTATFWKLFFPLQKES